MRTGRLSVGGWFAVLGGAAAFVVVAAVTAGLVTALGLTDARERLIDRIDVAAVSVLRLSTALVDEDTGVRAYVLTGQRTVRTPVRRGRQSMSRAFRELDRVTAGDDSLAELRSLVGRARAATNQWHDGYVDRVVRRVRDEGPSSVGPETIAEGAASLGQVRDAVASLEQEVLRERRVARAELDDAAAELNRFLVAGGIALLAAIAFAGLLLRRTVNLPLDRLTAAVRAVAGGRFDLPVRASGPRDVVQLGRDVEAMRQALEAARVQVEEQAADLQRSNSELEQFAYVASHDLQEPLRKVASFCQVLERRYGDELDERGRQYLRFAADGAKRMQELINDLLAFSRVGRLDQEHGEVELGEVAGRALDALGTAVEESGATVDVGPLPRVCGDPTLLALVLQNLVGNGLKFRGDGPPVVRVRARRASPEEWEISVQDNGIGVEEQYAERIFVIFQRLHPRDAYEGTGIGLAMCRKIVEHHGGRLWLDTGDGAAGDLRGATFRFTLPAIQDHVQGDG